MDFIVAMLIYTSQFHQPIVISGFQNEEICKANISKASEQIRNFKNAQCVSFPSNVTSLSIERNSKVLINKMNRN